MRENRRLDVASLAVDSFVTVSAPKPTHPAPERPTCMLTQCGNIQCCA